MESARYIGMALFYLFLFCIPTFNFHLKINTMKFILFINSKQIKKYPTL
jgi:hypothetical protein